jgi:hypothetical protein
METWVLLVITLTSGQPNGITSIPGYLSLDTCQAAGEVIQGAQQGQIIARCIPGPKK